MPSKDCQLEFFGHLKFDDLRLVLDVCFFKHQLSYLNLAIVTGKQVGDSKETAGDKPEEGGDDVKSAWPLCLGPHTCYNGQYKPLQTREGELIG